MAYKKAKAADKKYFSDCIDEYVEGDAPVRLFDAFVDSLNMTTLALSGVYPKIQIHP